MVTAFMNPNFEKETYDNNSYNLSGTILLVLVLLPFVQIGLSYYFSIQSVLFILMSLHINWHSLRSNLPSAIFLLILMLIQYITHDRVYVDDVFRTLREFMCLMLMMVMIDGSYKINNVLSAHLVKFILTIALVIIIILLVQQLGITQGVLLFVPDQFMASNVGTEQLGLSDLQSSPELVRPKAFWGEPSYLGFWAFTMLVIVLHYMPSQNTTLGLYAIGMLLIAVLISKTISGILSLLILLVIHNGRNILRMRYIWWVLLVFMFVGVIYLSLATFDDMTWWMKRLFNIYRGDDESNFIRMIAPLSQVYFVFIWFPLGLPLTRLANIYPSYHGIAVDNAFFNLFMEFGWLGFPIFAMLWFKTSRYKLLFPYVLISSMFNGALLALDKAAVIALVSVLVIAKSNEQEIYSARLDSSNVDID